MLHPLHSAHIQIHIHHLSPTVTNTFHHHSIVHLLDHMLQTLLYLKCPILVDPSRLLSNRELVEVMRKRGVVVQDGIGMDHWDLLQMMIQDGVMVMVERSSRAQCIAFSPGRGWGDVLNQTDGKVSMHFGTYRQLGKHLLPRQRLLALTVGLLFYYMQVYFLTDHMVSPLAPSFVSSETPGWSDQ